MKPTIKFYLDNAVVELHFSDGPYAIIYCTVEEHWPEMLTISPVEYATLKLLNTEQQLKITDEVDLMDFWAIPDLLSSDELLSRIKMLFADYPIICNMLYQILHKWIAEIITNNPEEVQWLTDSFLTELGELTEDLDQED